MLRGGCTGSIFSLAPSSPFSTSRPSITASTDDASPSTFTRWARPRLVRTTARSPGRASFEPFFSSTTGEPATKNGSPEMSFPRLEISTTSSSPNALPGAAT